MFFEFQNKGIFVPAFFLLFVIGIPFLLDKLFRKIDNFYILLFYIFTGVIVSAIVTYIFRDDYYKNDKGEKVSLDIKNTFFFINMKWWAYIEFFLGILGLSFSLYKIFIK